MPNRIPTPSVPTPTVRTSKSAQPAAVPLTNKEIKRVNAIAKTVKPVTGNAALNANIKKLTPAGVKADTARQTKAIASAHAKSGYGK